MLLEIALAGKIKMNKLGINTIFSGRGIRHPHPFRHNFFSNTIPKDCCNSPRHHFFQISEHGDLSTGMNEACYRFTNLLGTDKVSKAPNTMPQARRYTPASVEPVASFSHPTA